MNKPKILIGVPCMDMMHSRFVQDLMKLNLYQSPYYDILDVTFVIGTLVFAARNDIVREAFKRHADYIMFLDSDITFDFMDVQRLLTDKKEIVTGMYFERKGLHKPTIFSSVEDRSEDIITVQCGDWKDRKKVFEIAGCGFGFTLVATKVCVEMVDNFNACFEHIDALGEDLSFCKRARKLGYSIYCDKSIKLGHIGTYAYTERDYMEEYELK